ncbi:MAG TPA: hypothetical protein VIH67_12185, partial [Candidatus Acidoferrum sp.]
MSKANQLRRIADHVNDAAALSSVPPAGSSRVDDAQLIRAAQQGSAEAFQQLVERYDRAVLRLTLHLTGS